MAEGLVRPAAAEVWQWSRRKTAKGGEPSAESGQLVPTSKQKRRLNNPSEEQQLQSGQHQVKSTNKMREQNRPKVICTDSDASSDTGDYSVHDSGTDIGVAGSSSENETEEYYYQDKSTLNETPVKNVEATSSDEERQRWNGTAERQSNGLCITDRGANETNIFLDNDSFNSDKKENGTINDDFLETYTSMPQNTALTMASSRTSSGSMSRNANLGHSVYFEDDAYSKEDDTEYRVQKSCSFWIPGQEISSHSNTVTVKFVMAAGEVLTQAYDISLCVGEIKRNLSSLFRVPTQVIQLSVQGDILDDNIVLSELGVEPFGSIEIDLQSTDINYQLSTEGLYQEYPVSDVITVRVETGEQEYRDVIVEIENRCTRKPFIGGYRHKGTGVEYHHAFSQTQPIQRDLSQEERMQRETQTVYYCDKNTGMTIAEKYTQIRQQDYFIPCIHDRIIVPQKYISAQDRMQMEAFEDKVVTIQRYIRGWLARRKISQIKENLKHCIDWETKEIQIQEEERETHLKHNAQRMTFPKTRADFNMLYNMVERWRKSEVMRILATTTTEAPKRVEFCSLLEKEIQLLSSIENHRIAIKEEALHKRELEIINKCSEPITWRGYKGLIISMDTIRTQRAREMRDLYLALSQHDGSNEERAELLESLKYANNRDRNQPITEQSGKHPHLYYTANNTTENSVSETSDKYKWKTVSYNKKDKRKSATNKEDDKNDFLLIGDSILKNVIVPDCKVDVRPGIRSHQLNKHFKNVLSTKRNTGETGNKTLSTDDYRGVLIHVGTNSIRSNSEEEIVNETRNLIRSAKTVYPTSRLVISGIIHRRSEIEISKTKNMFYCERCCKLLPYLEFSPNSRMKSLKQCSSCMWIQNVAVSRTDYGPYSYIMQAVRREEQKRKCFSSVAFIMQEQDFYYLVMNIWHGHSAISESRDINTLRLPRWNIKEDWSPWNCILLTDNETKAHINLENINQTYVPEFIEQVEHKHMLAKRRFDRLAKIVLG
ncbi:IQ and ubiquitin-like domain-containing protein [Schistocerca nitens]|uniref:IQ and ubiquitin-like domain-containing protein n=1 Tax=Schistocerca nitens TaxID=7011 RepID=UPI0021197A66|nr:IQ and ubiquitin-like domain-containing protein [Schistocerca nitens]